MLINELSRLTGVSVRSLRHYEKKGLIESTRLPNGYRSYEDHTVKRVETIHFYIKLGFSTDQIAQFLSCVLKHKEAHCDEVKPLYEEKIKAITEQLEYLIDLKNKLEAQLQEIERSTMTHSS